ncbi:MAG: ATP-binding protein [Saprospiraceae bacterium]|nr:ATP-binding protein [Saprospiraceae bacterium]
MFYSRNILSDLQDHLQNKQVTVLTGMRRTGKTTLVKRLMDSSPIRQKIYFDLERIDNRELFSEKNYDNIVFALTQRGIVFSEKVLIAIDEIQLVPNLPSVLKYLYDTYDIKFLLTGSSSYYIKNRFNESLAGRKKIFEVYPLTFNELLAFKGVEFSPIGTFYQRPFIVSEYERLKNYYDEYINYGGFPEVVLSDKVSDKKDLIHDILSSYINLDIASVMDFKKSADCFKLIKLLAVRIGSKLDISKLSLLTTLTRASIENYLELFEQSYLIRTIPVTSNSPDREIVKARKIYFLDNGIASVSAELSSGSKFENAIFNQLHHFGDLSYYQLKTGNEIDFILNKNRAFEVKEAAFDNDLRNLKNLAKNLKIDDCFVIGRRPNSLFDGLLWGGFIQ